MTGVQVPADAVPAGYVHNPHTSKVDAVLAFLHSEKASTEGWQEIGTKDGITTEKKVATDNSPIPTLRSRGIVKNMTPVALLAAISLPSARPNWDDRYVTGGLLERYDRYTNKYYAVQKGAGFLVSERDVVGVQTIIVPEGGADKGFEVVQTSVEGDPENSGRVRATITCAGWSVVPRGEDLEIAYVIKMNPNGKLPSAVVGKLIEGLPTVVAKVLHFVRSSGHPPFILTPSFSSQLRTEIFDLKGRAHTAKFIASNQEEELVITVDPKPFGGSWKVQVSGNGDLSAEKKGPTSAVVRIPARSGKFEVRITAE
ncbi:hypothetical protein FRC08_015743 [Ceratobasidium sp. 394]|nr:hypothetical protein FRC08_015743 [Ceratobasidium sp. 394]KAG9091444.1 hypothetical protein FS749_016539 [Ceratobasidium sp. UAMH 11750]